MKKTLIIIAALIIPFFSARSQDNGGNGDDAYYNDDNDQQPPADPNNGQPAGDAPTYQTFYDQLSPYGNWINDPTYGYVWSPGNMDPDFSPYLSGGHWVYTEYGWTWVSDYAWGWGPFHYGRWYQNEMNGWMWAPGYDWAPAWVTWGNYEGYYCWAPVGPREVLGPHYRPDPHHWNFVPHEHIAQGNVRNYVVNHDVVIHNDYAGINNRIAIVTHANTYNQSVFYAGPKQTEVEKYVGHKIDRVTVNNVTRPGATKVNGNHVDIYRPAIVRTNVQHATPTKVVKPEETHTNTNVQHQTTNQPRNENVPQQHTQPVQQPKQEWTPPRQNTPRQNIPQQQPQRTEPVQQQRPVDRGFVPSQRPVQQAPQQQQHFSQPVQQSRPAPAMQSRPAPAMSAPRGGGGGGRH